MNFEVSVERVVFLVSTLLPDPALLDWQSLCECGGGLEAVNLGGLSKLLPRFRPLQLPPSSDFISSQCFCGSRTGGASESGKLSSSGSSSSSSSSRSSSLIFSNFNTSGIGS